VKFFLSDQALLALRQSSYYSIPKQCFIDGNITTSCEWAKLDHVKLELIVSNYALD